MATLIGVGQSKDSDAFAAGRSAAEVAFGKIKNKNANIVFVFASIRFDQNQLIKGVLSVFQSAQLIGCSDAGEITNDGPGNNSVVVMAIASDSIKFAIGAGSGISKNPREAGRELARLVIKDNPVNRSALIMLPDGLTGNGADIIRGAQDILGTSFPIVGGSAGDDFIYQKTYQYYNNRVLSDYVLGALIYGDVVVGIGARHGWKPLSKPRLVTKASANIIEELDGRTAANIYEEYFGKHAEELKKESLARLTVVYPLGMSIPGEEEYLVRNVLNVSPDGSLVYAAEIPEGAEVRLMMGSKEDAISAARLASQQALQQIGQKKVDAVIVFDSFSRSKLLGRRTIEEIDEIKRVFGDVPVIGFYAYGEQAPLKSELHLGKTHFHNETIVVLAIAEKEK